MSAHAAVRPFNASRPRPRPIPPSRMHAHARFLLANPRIIPGKWAKVLEVFVLHRERTERYLSDQ